MSPTGNLGTVVERDGGSYGFTFSVAPEPDDDLNALASDTVRITYSIGGLDAHEYTEDGCSYWDDDAGESRPCVYIDPGQTSRTVTVRLLNDAIADGDDTLTVSLSGAESTACCGGGGGCCGGGGGCCGGVSYSVDPAVQEATVTIQDDDGWAIKVEADTPGEIVELDGASGFSISRVDDGSGRSGDTS